MELRTLRYFLETAREENMTRAAQRLHVSQSTLSKQLKGLEEELGRRLFIRHSFSIELTPEGMLLRKRAEDLIAMSDKITMEFAAMDDIIGGNVYLGCAESVQIRYLAQAIRSFKDRYPGFHYHMTSGDTQQVLEKLDGGLLDLALIVEEPDRNKYHVLAMPGVDRWGVVMPADCDLAEKPSVTFEDLLGRPLFCSRQSWEGDLPRWCQARRDELTLEGTFRLSYNGSIFVKEGLGLLLTFEHLIDTGAHSNLVFRPLSPPLTNPLYLLWRRRQLFTPIAQRFIDHLQSIFGEEDRTVRPLDKTPASSYK